jgi:quercetin dioxygenase-like cupin family protein
MKYTRIYSDAEGESHLEDVEIPMNAAPYNTGSISDMFGAKGVMFRVSPDYFVDWHNAPRRQFVINVTGSLEVTTSDGTKRVFGPGTVLLAEDVSGKGHTSRGVGNGERLSLFIPLE